MGVSLFRQARRARLFLGDGNFDAAVLGATFGIVGAVGIRIWRNRLCLAPTARAEIGGVDAGIRGQPFGHRRGAALGQRLVIGVGALAIGVAFDRHLGIRIGLEH